MKEEQENKKVLVPVKVVRKRGRPKEKVSVKPVTLFLDAELLQAFDEACETNKEKNRTRAVEAMMRAYIDRDKSTASKQDVIDTVVKILDELL